MTRRPDRARLAAIVACGVLVGVVAWRMLLGTDGLAPSHGDAAPHAVETPTAPGAPELPARAETPLPTAAADAEAGADAGADASVERGVRAAAAPGLDTSGVLGRLPATPTRLDLAGTVRTTDGAPVEGALLRFQMRPDAWDGGDGGDGGDAEAGSAVTDAAGRYRVEGLAIASLRLTCTWKDSRSGRSGALTLVLGFLDPREPREIDIVVPISSVPIEQTVRVTDERGVPCSDHRVEFVSEFPQPGGRRARIEHGPVVTGIDGRCRAPVLHTGTMEVVVSGPGDGDLWSWLSWPPKAYAPAREHELKKEESRRFVVVDRADADELDLGVPAHDVLVMGVLHDASGRPFDAKSRLTGYRPWLATEEDGALMLPAGDGHFEALAPPGPGTIRLPLPATVVAPEVSYDHRFLQDVGIVVVSPAAGLRITLQDTADDGNVFEPTVRLQLTDEAGESQQSKLDPSGDGSFLHWSGLASGRYEITASAPGYVTARVAGDLRAGERAQEVLVRMDQRR